jgi:hypothetical protein
MVTGTMILLNSEPMFIGSCKTAAISRAIPMLLRFTIRDLPAKLKPCPPRGEETMQILTLIRRIPAWFWLALVVALFLALLI